MVDHIAILRRSPEHLLEEMLAGQKTMESRCYSARFMPWNQMSARDIIYFNYSSMPAEAEARVKYVKQFSELTQKKVRRFGQ